MSNFRSLMDTLDPGVYHQINTNASSYRQRVDDALDSINGGRSIFGNYRDALVEILEHAGWAVEAAEVTRLVDRAARDIKSLDKLLLVVSRKAEKKRKELQ